jgi:hypothetical protein
VRSSVPERCSGVACHSARSRCMPIAMPVVDNLIRAARTRTSCELMLIQKDNPRCKIIHGGLHARSARRGRERDQASAGE